MNKGFKYYSERYIHDLRLSAKVPKLHCEARLYIYTLSLLTRVFTDTHTLAGLGHLSKLIPSLSQQ